MLMSNDLKATIYAFHLFTALSMSAKSALIIFFGFKVGFYLVSFLMERSK